MKQEDEQFYKECLVVLFCKHKDKEFDIDDVPWSEITESFPNAFQRADLITNLLKLGYIEQVVRVEECLDKVGLGKYKVLLPKEWSTDPDILGALV